MADIHLKPIARFKIFGSICKIEPATSGTDKRVCPCHPCRINKMKIPIQLNLPPFSITNFILKNHFVYHHVLPLRFYSSGLAPLDLSCAGWHFLYSHSHLCRKLAHHNTQTTPQFDLAFASYNGRREDLFLLVYCEFPALCLHGGFETLQHHYHHQPVPIES